MACDNETPPSAQQASENVEGQSVTTSAAIPAPTSADSSSNKSEHDVDSRNNQSDNDVNKDSGASDNDVDKESGDSDTDNNIRMPPRASGAPRHLHPLEADLHKAFNERVQASMAKGWVNLGGGHFNQCRVINADGTSSLIPHPFPPGLSADTSVYNSRTTPPQANNPRPTPPTASAPIMDRIGGLVQRAVCCSGISEGIRQLVRSCGDNEQKLTEILQRVSLKPMPRDAKTIINGLSKWSEAREFLGTRFNIRIHTKSSTQIAYYSVHGAYAKQLLYLDDQHPQFKEKKRIADKKEEDWAKETTSALVVTELVQHPPVHTFRPHTFGRRKCPCIKTMMHHYAAHDANIQCEARRVLQEAILEVHHQMTSHSLSELKSLKLGWNPLDNGANTRRH
ncbi:hypothetical protein GCK72_007624 [Caenorhabditis remanei]|uniref:Uncharacterized protein n=1 Tax=Caenorhabditis remanei TaxID=31234 RepID=A0A6A5HJJ4_CAERE|nr:hypothetical protein GCK72_007624 [Caenorhabditis remanei]KAF1767665.1 hypothetical protein GCK72_007624 [Caenorhabditis remanei]